MCGIAGYISTKKITKDTFKKSLCTLSKRGPDDQGTTSYVVNDKQIFLGQQRLAILDLSPSGHQPMEDEDKNIVLLNNGEIYNFKEIRSKLEAKGYTFKSTGDTEVLLKAYKEYGEKVVDMIEGMFAFVILDKNKQKIFCARDHFGKKPFFYFLTKDTFIFGSELKALAAYPEVKKQLTFDELSIVKYLYYGYIPSPNTIFTQVKKLEPAHTLSIDLHDFRVKKRKYWDLNTVKVNNNLSEKEILQKIENLLSQSVQKRLISDVPLGVFLSGGVDSSLITAMMTKHSDNVNSFTISYKNYKNDETKYAKKVANHLGIKNNFYNFEGTHVKKHIQEIIDYLDEPIADPAIIPLYFLAKYAKKNITVVLSGDGGDEIFGGYDKYFAQKIIQSLHSLKFLTPLIKSQIKNEVYHKFISGFEWSFSARQFIFGSGSFLPEQMDKLLKNNQYSLDEIFKEAKEYDESFQQKDTINRSLYLDCKIQLPDWYLVKGDRGTMATSLEMRNPLLDKSLAEFMFSIPGKYKIKNKESKYILKKLAAKYIPKEVIYRRKKGFAVPLEKWLEKELQIQNFIIRSKTLKKLIDIGYSNSLRDDFRKNKYLLYRLYVLDHFLQKYE